MGENVRLLNKHLLLNLFKHFLTDSLCNWMKIGLKTVKLIDEMVASGQEIWRLRQRLLSQVAEILH